MRFYIFNYMMRHFIIYGDWGLGIGDWAQYPKPKPPTPTPQPKKKNEIIICLNILFF